MSSSQASLPPLPFWMNVLAGAAAGGTELMVLYPLDVVKTRFQLAKSVGGVRPSMVGALRGLALEAGFLGMYRGLLAPLAVEPLKRAVKFSGNATYKGLLMGPGRESVWRAVGAGFLAGCTEALVIAAPEVVKVRMQAAERRGVYRNSADAALKIFRSEGPLAFTQGLEAALWRNGVWNGSFFGAVFAAKRAMGEWAHRQKTAANFIAGLCGGALGTTLNNPLDVVASRMRNILPGEPAPYRAAFPAVLHIARTEGASALYKGYFPKLARLGPGGGILIVVFDQVTNALRKIYH